MKTRGWALLLVLAMAMAMPTALADDPYGRYEETIKISVLSQDSKDNATEYDSSNPARKSASENAWIDGYKEYLNIEVDRQIAEDSTALNARINTGLAAGDLPDIMIVPKTMFYVLAENGVLQDLTAAYEGYTQSRLLAEAVATSPDSLLTGMYEGEMLGFPVIGNSYNSSKVLFIRQDWLEKVGMEAPQTIDEMIAVAKAFQEAKLGGDSTIGLGVTGVSEPILSAYGAILDTWAQQEDGTYVYANTTAPIKDGLLKMQEMYKDGVIKNDFAVTNILGEEVANGVCGMYYAEAWQGVTSVKASLLNDAEAVWVPVAIPTVDGGEAVKQWTNNTIGSFYAVNANCENPEALFKMIELELHMYYEPSPEELVTYYACEDGYTMWNLRVFRNFGRADLDLYKASLMWDAYAKGETEIAEISKSSYERVLRGLDGDREQLGLAITYMDGYKITYDNLQAGLLVAAYDGPITENMTLYQNTVNEALTNAMLKVIMGEDISVYETAVDTWYKTGGQAITDDVNAYYASLE